MSANRRAHVLPVDAGQPGGIEYSSPKEPAGKAPERLVDLFLNRATHGLILILPGLTACATSRPAVDEAARKQMLALLMPSSIEIVEPFTAIKSLDRDDTPDGIEVLLQAVNALDTPGLMVAGTIRVDLYEYVAASADQKGGRLDHWDIQLATKENQHKYWNHMTQMYQFRLGVDPKIIPPAKRYVLTVTYTSPLGDYLTDECTLQYRSPVRPLGGRTSQRP